MPVRFLALCAVIILFFAMVPFAISRAQTAAPAATAPAPAAATADEGVIGTILEVEGTATLAPQGGTPAPAAVNTPVHLNDVIATGPSSRAFILLIDNTQWTLSENSKLTVDQWVYDPDDNTNNKGRYSILQGAFEYVSGLITKKPNPDVEITTPAGSIGIRGTDITGGDIDGEYGVQVDEGVIDVKTDAGQVRVNKGEGTTWRGRGAAPGKPAQWKAERLQQIRQKVYLQHRERVQQRMAQMQERHQEMRQHYKQFMKTHPDGRLQQRREMQQERREQMQQRRGEMQEKRELRREKFEQRQEQKRGGEQAQNLGWRPRENRAVNNAAGAGTGAGGGPGGGAWKERLQQARQQQAGQAQPGTAQPAKAALEARREKREDLREARKKRWEQLKEEKEQQEQQQQPAPR